MLAGAVTLGEAIDAAEAKCEITEIKAIEALQCHPYDHIALGSGLRGTAPLKRVSLSERGSQLAPDLIQAAISVLDVGPLAL